jgi:hypothetical protein
MKINLTEEQIAGLIALIPAYIAAEGYIGWRGWKGNLLHCLILAGTGGLIAGMIHGRKSFLGMLLYPIPFVVGTTAFMFITAWYLVGKESVYTLELIIPGLISFIPFFIVYWLINRLLTLFHSKD